MTKDEFAKSAVVSGYGNKESMKSFLENSPKENFTEDDYIEFYHFCNKWYGNPVKGLIFSSKINGKTTAFSNG